MYGNGILQGDVAVTVANDKFEYLKAMYAQAKVFLNYFEKTWMYKIEMLVRVIVTCPMLTMARMLLLRVTMPI